MEDGRAQISGLCRACHYNHCEDKHRLVKEHWAGRIQDLKGAVAIAKAKLEDRYDANLVKMKNDAEEMVAASGREMERELREVGKEFEIRWGG